MSESAGRLLPCPFCGEDAQMSSRADDHSPTGFIYFIVCYCGGHSAAAHKHGHTWEEAREKWNRRAPAPSPAGPDALAEELHPAIKRLMNLAHEFWDDGLEQSNKIILECCEQLEQALHSRPAQDRDAERYRWLREARLDAGRNQISMVTIHGMEHAFEELDAAIDAAMSQQEPNK